MIKINKLRLRNFDKEPFDLFKSKVYDMEFDPLIFSFFNIRETVFLEIGFPVFSQNAREINVAAWKRSFKDI